MKEHAVKRNLKKNLGFYAVLVLCMAMISFACWYAYEQTRNQIVMNLDSAVGDIKVMEVQTDIPKQTEAATERELLTEAPFIAEPLQTAPIQTQPITQEAAVVDAPETAPVMPETEALSTEAGFPISGNPPCYPLNGEIIGEFSGGELVKSPTTGIWQTHNGIDIAGNQGDTVCAIDAGIVKNVENDALWGITVTIEHQNGIISRYCSLNNGLSVNTGDKVENGTIIGALGNTADIESAMPTHLHFELMQGEHYLNPVEYLGTPQTTETAMPETT